MLSDLHLTLHKIHFDDMAEGRKDVEYRSIKPFWTKRLFIEGDPSRPRKFNDIHFTNGYGKKMPYMRRKYLSTSIQKYKGIDCYALFLGPVEGLKNWTKS